MASGRGTPSMGLCSRCEEKCAESWTASPCKHEVCTKCLETAGNTATCFKCPTTVAFLACPGSRHGCKFDTTKGSWKDHLSKCLFLPLECPNRCGMIVVRKQLLSHFAADCQLRLTACQFCEETVFEVEVRDHENSCPKAPVSCPHCLQEGLKREEMAQHTESCSKTPKPCPLREYGCDFSGVDEDIDQHLTVRNHVVVFRELKKSQQEHKLEVEKLWSKVDFCTSELDSCKSDLQTCRSELDSCKSELDSCKSDLETCRSELNSCKKELATLTDGGGAIIIGRTMDWVFQLPNISSGSLFSPLYRHRRSGTVLYLRLSFSQREEGGYSITFCDCKRVNVTLYLHIMRKGRDTLGYTCYFSVDSVDYRETTQYYDESGRKLERGTERETITRKIMTKATKTCNIHLCDEKILETQLVTGEQYVISYGQTFW